MSKNYTQLSLEQRYQIEALSRAGHKQTAIALLVNVHPSTICRELKRNTPRGGVGSNLYWATNAQRRTALRHRLKPKITHFTDQQRQYCREKLALDKFSPELISATGKQAMGSFVSHETIYKWIWNCKHSNCRKDKVDEKLYKLLKHGHRKQKRGNRNDKRGNVPGRVFIDNRPQVVAKRKRLGDLEVDLMIGQKHRSAILVCLDRCSRKILLCKLKSKESQEIRTVLINRLEQHKSWLRTMTFDNDSAFMQHKAIAQSLQVNTYFTRPYTSQDKGSVENRIGVVRRFLPKSTDLSLVTAQQLRQIESLINNRPMKLFNFKTPNQVFSEKIALIS